VSTDKPTGPGTGSPAADAGATPRDELGIPGLAPRRAATSNWRSVLAGSLLVLSMAAVLVSVIWKRFAPDEAPPPKLPIAADQLPPIRFDERDPVAAAAAPTAPTPSGAPTVPAAAAGATTPAAAPVALQATPSAAPVGYPPGYAPGYAPGYGGGGGGGGYAPHAIRAPRDDSPFVTPVGTAGAPAAGPAALLRTGHVPQHTGHPMATAAANLEQYQQQLDGMVRQLQALTDQAQGGGTPSPLNGVPFTSGAGGTGGPGSAMPTPMAAQPMAPSPGPAPARPLFGQLERSNTPRAHATMLGARSFVVPKGVLFQCALKTRIVSAVSGFVGCQVQRPVYSDDGKVVLIERGSHLDGEYRIVQVRPGVTRIPILWTRVRTPHGVTVDLDSPATGPLGESGVTGEINHRWAERIGAALLLSLIDDAIKLQISENTAQSGNTVVLPNTAATTSRLAEKVLDSTIHIPPLITTHQGSVVGVYVSRDLDFSGVYRLEAR
jgi:type IV secretion system protein VirB10